LFESEIEIALVILRELFEQCLTNPAETQDFMDGLKTKEVKQKHVVVIGAGTMGVDIAAAFLANGWSASLIEPNVDIYPLAKARLDHALSMLGGQGQEAQFIDAIAKVRFSGITHGLVIEAVPESLPLKQRVFAELAEIVPAGIPLCSNSSAIPISYIGQGLEACTRMVGTHFFMPAHLVPGVEVISSDQTDPEVASRVAQDLRSAGRVPIMVKRDIPGFLVNRLQHALLREAFSLVDQGIATIEDIDAAVRFGFGFRYLAAGPCLQRDHAGLDIHYAAGCSIYPDLCNDTKPAKVLKDKVDAGHYGMKCGQGFQVWDEEGARLEKARYEALLLATAELLRAELS
jgi:3-hydroxybutyryl-CoA dehydrogenase